MSFTTTRDQRAWRWRFVPSLLAATVAFSACQIICTSGSMAQVKAPSKYQLKAPSKSAAPAAPAEDVQPFAISANGQVTDQLTALNIDPADAQAANDAVVKALEQLDRKTTNSGRAVLQAQGAGKPKRLVSLQLYSAKSLAVELQRSADGSYGYKLAPNATENDDERVSSVPSQTQAAPAGARQVVSGSVALVKVSASSGLATSLASTGASSASLKELTEDLDSDPTARELASALPDDATIVIVGWSDTIPAALVRRGDVRVLVVDQFGDGNGLVRQLDDRDVDAHDVPSWGLGSAVASADVVALEAAIAGDGGIVAPAGSLAAAATARAIGAEVWAVVPVGRALPSPMWRYASAPLGGPDPWNLEDEVVPVELIDAMIGPTGKRPGDELRKLNAAVTRTAAAASVSRYFIVGRWGKPVKGGRKQAVNLQRAKNQDSADISAIGHRPPSVGQHG